MASQTISEVHRIHRLIWAFNHEVEFSSAYSNRKDVLTTPTVFFDFEGDKLPPMAPSQDGWCKISAQLEAQLVQYKTEVHMIEFDERHERILLDSEEFMDACKVEAPKYLNKLACLYLNCFATLADDYEPDVKDRVKAKALSLIQDFEANRIDHKDYISTVEYIKQQIRAAIKAGSEPPPPVHHKLTRTELTDKVLKLQGERIYSVKDICTICRISQYKYYTLIKEHKRRERGIEKVKCGPGAKSRLNTEHIKFIKELVDAPYASYTVPEICQELLICKRIDVGKKAVYYQLTKKMGYSYKRNHVKYPTAFYKGQAVVKYKVCKVLLDYMMKGKNIISIDESGFHTGIQKQYSYAKKGQHPFRICWNSSKRLNVAMAVSNQCIFAYQGREQGHNEHSFCAFIIDLATKIISLGPEQVANTVLFMDNAPFHKSSLPLKLFGFLPFPVVCNVVAWSDLNPIETVFAMLKSKIRELPFHNM